ATKAASPVPPPRSPEPEAVAAAAALLAHHPDAVILAGRGALAASGPLLAVAERLQIPVLTTIHGRGVIDEDHLLALGPQGFSASHWAERYLEAHKPAVVLAIGTSLRELSTNVFDPALGGTVGLIHVTRDAKAIGRHYPTRLGAVADAGAFLEALLPHLPQRPPNMAIAHFKADVARYDHAGLGDGPGGLSPRRVVQAIRQVMSPTDMLFADTGNAVPWSVRYFPVHRPGTYFASMHRAALGWGVAAAIGAAIACPERRVVSLVGDGCFQMAGMEVATAVHEQVPVVWVVLNDARLNMVHQGSSAYYGEAIPGTRLNAISAAAVAEGLGALGLRVDHPDDLLPALTAAFQAGRPTVVDVAIDPRFEPPMSGRAQALRRFEERGMGL
ncbi:MAG: thiamine pyrophosphate-binding protein, partial [Candidatus Sericytochromatia bacterium]